VGKWLGKEKRKRERGTRGFTNPQKYRLPFPFLFLIKLKTPFLKNFFHVSSR